MAKDVKTSHEEGEKYEKGVNRIGAGRLFDLAHVLGVPIDFFYEDAPAHHLSGSPGSGFSEPSAENDLVDFLATREGLELNKAFVQITDQRVRRSIIEMVRALADESK